MKRLSLIIALFSLGFSGLSQILNTGFEEISGFPNSYGQFSFVDNWSNANSNSSSPDYYHRHASGDVDLPNSLGAFVEPFEGDAIMGIIACGNEGANKREYISTVLEYPMTVGADYLISFRVCNGYISDNSYMGFGIDHLGIALSTNGLNQNGDDPLIVPTHFEIDSVFFDRDWQQFSFIITADQAYENLTFGVFKMDHDLEFVSYEDNAQLVYYFVDDFFMMELPEDYDPTLADTPKGDTSITNDNPGSDLIGDENVVQPFFIPNAFTPNGDGDNDTFIPIAEFPGTLDEYKFEVFSRWGELLFSTNDMKAGWDGYFKGELLEGDVFVWNITYNEYKKEQVFTRKFSGSVNLIR